MSETIKKSGKAAVACGDIKTNGNKGIIIEQGTYGLSGNETRLVPGMEISAYENKVTNELGEPVTRVDANGNKIPVEAKYTTIGKTLAAIDKARNADRASER